MPLSGQRPHVLREMIGKGVLSWDLQSAAILGWAALGNASPGALRWLMRLLIRARDTLAGFEIRDGTPYEWRLNCRTQDVSSGRYQIPTNEFNFSARGDKNPQHQS